MGGAYDSINGKWFPRKSVPKNHAFITLAEKGVEFLGSEKKNEQTKKQLTSLNQQFANIDKGAKDGKKN